MQFADEQTVYSQGFSSQGSSYFDAGDELKSRSKRQNSEEYGFGDFSQNSNSSSGDLDLGIPFSQHSNDADDEGTVAYPAERYAENLPSSQTVDPVTEEPEVEEPVRGSRAYKYWHKARAIVSLQRIAKGGDIQFLTDVLVIAWDMEEDEVKELMDQAEAYNLVHGDF